MEKCSILFMNDKKKKKNSEVKIFFNKFDFISATIFVSIENDHKKNNKNQKEKKKNFEQNDCTQMAEPLLLQFAAIGQINEKKNLFYNEAAAVMVVVVSKSIVSVSYISRNNSSSCQQRT